ncbi:levansucrase [Streptomyces sp. B6B3]|uniref:levansucrase n=1 Tax=Streptomyces sp. B6B3 TaxID=3153570 RepID=UPI00325F3441
MTVDPTPAYLSSVGDKLAADGCSPRWHNEGGTPVLIGRRSDFRVGWGATKLHLFTLAAAVPEITVPVIADFTQHAIRYAKAHKGGLPRGLQTGVAVFPALISTRIDPQAVAWAEQKQRTQFACFARPVVVDVIRRYVGVYRGSPIIGRTYASHLLQKSDYYFSGSAFSMSA